MTLSIPAETLYRKKMTILICGIIMYFLTSMAKVLVPATIFAELQALGFDAQKISATGAAFMYSYAASQLLAGIFADRYGGVRILLIGGSLFASGSILFPVTGNFHLMIICRVMTGFGAGTVFLGVAKLLSDLFSAKFAFMLGAVCLMGFFGPTAGTVPVTYLIGIVGWRIAMMIPGFIALLALAVIICRMHGTIKPTVGGQTLQPLFAMLKNRNMWMMCLSASVIFGVYYCISSQFGQKSLSDFCGLNRQTATAVIMLLTIIVACNNMGGNLLLKLCGGRRKCVAWFAIISTLTGTLLAALAFRNQPSAGIIIAAYALIAIPAGFFPLFGTIAKELNPPESVALAVAFVNFWCFVYIAVFQNITGNILQRFADSGSTVFPPQAYSNVFVFLAAAAILGGIMNFFYPETGK